MPNLADVVQNPLPQLTVTLGTASMPLQWQCHQAVLAWLYEAEFGATITGAQFGTFFLDFQPTMKAILDKGMRVFRPGIGKLIFKPGTVLIFANKGTPEHSCILEDSDTIVGYNQTDWFSTAGRVSDISWHNTGDLKWEGGIVTRGSHKYTLWAIIEKLAREVVRTRVTTGHV